MIRETIAKIKKTAMELTAEIPVRKTLHSRISEVDFNNLEFGKYVSDHMLICDFSGGEWKAPQIVPYANLAMSPTALALHYGQTVFEGMKAFRMKDGRINIFRMGKHYERFVRSLERMCMAVVPKEIFMEGIAQLVMLDKDWIPSGPGTSLYIRPFVFASEARFGVKVSEEYRFIIFTGPVPSLYVNPIKVKVETRYVRAGKGGTGFAKCGGNYGGAFLPTQQARKEGYDQVLWTDGKENRFIEESGMMNIMFVIGESLVTPPLSDSILDGITRDSLLAISKDLGYKTEVRPVSVEELEKAFMDGTLKAAFGAGTAAVVAPIKTIHLNGIDFQLPLYSRDNILYKLKQKLEDIRAGIDADIHDWNVII
ncbi:MAG TPA: branched-chain amino acid aminotransferase [Ferruginibacter sp.]|nr:branched-chain amino acid aminotransferase [Ferruginibacter sp.]